MTNGTEHKKMKIPYGESDISKSQDSITVEKPGLEHNIILPKVIKNSIVLDEIKPEISEKLLYFAGKGALLHGFQGVGKTCLVYKLAQDNNAQIIKIHKEMPPQQIKAAFDYARDLSNNQKIFIFIDEIDDFGQKEYAKYSGGISKIIALMTELDEIKKEANNNLYVFATTNYLDNVDSRLLRPGRLEEIVEIPLPDRDARKEIAALHAQNTKNKDIEKYVDFIAKNTSGFTPADLRGVFKYLLRETIKNGRLGEDKVLEIIKGFEPSVKRGFEYFKNPEKGLKDVVGRKIYFEFFKDILSKGIKGSANFMLYGPRGTGKTLIPEVLADYFGFNYLSAKGSELQEGIVGEGTKKLKRFFNSAYMSAPCIAVFDEIDGFITARDTVSHKDDETAYFNAETSRKKPGVYIFATINNPLKINPTTLTRFEHKVFNELPSKSEMKEYLKRNLNGRVNDSATIMTEQMSGYSFRDIENFVYLVKRYDEKYSFKGSEDKVISTCLSKITPENMACEENWNNIKDHVGDSISLEKLIYEINKEIGGKK